MELKNHFLKIFKKICLIFNSIFKNTKIYIPSHKIFLLKMNFLSNFLLPFFFLFKSSAPKRSISPQHEAFYVLPIEPALLQKVEDLLVDEYCQDSTTYRLDKRTTKYKEKKKVQRVAKIIFKK